MTAQLGEIVRYLLTDWDAADINRRRHDFSAYARSHPRPGEPGLPGASGHIGHHGNKAAAGDAFPAMIVRVWAGSDPSANLQVFLDGNDVFWATSRHEGDGPGLWLRTGPFRPVSLQDMAQAAIELRQ